MVDNQAWRLDRVFQALASAPRREILRRAARGPCTVTELAAHFDMSLAAVAKHVRVLDEAELLAETRQGRLHWRRLNPRALEPAHASLEELRRFWTQQLDALGQHLAAEAAPFALPLSLPSLPSPPSPPPARARKPRGRRRR